MRLGVFGGRFDPVHVGHLLAATQAREELGLDEVWFVPSADPPHKPAAAPAAARLAMVRLAVASDPAFRASDLELRRPGPSYTVDTLEAIRALRPRATLFLLLGADAARDLWDWERPLDVLEYAQVAVLPRSVGEGAHSTPLSESIRDRVLELPARRFDVSATEIRRRLREGLGVRHLVPHPVEMYLATTDLYDQ